MPIFLPVKSQAGVWYLLSWSERLLYSVAPRTISKPSVENFGSYSCRIPGVLEGGRAMHPTVLSSRHTALPNLSGCVYVAAGVWWRWKWRMQRVHKTPRPPLCVFCNDSRLDFPQHSQTTLWIVGQCRHNPQHSSTFPDKKLRIVERQKSSSVDGPLRRRVNATAEKKHQFTTVARPGERIIIERSADETEGQKWVSVKALRLPLHIIFMVPRSEVPQAHNY